VSREHVIEELSAYIDGEAKDPARIARHLQFCESCARHHMQLLKLSANLRALPPPETRPEFITRVMAHVAETGVRHGRFSWGVAVPALVFAAAILLAAGLAWRNQTPEATSSPNRIASGSQGNDNEAVVNAIENMIARGADFSLFEDIGDDAPEPFSDASVDDIIDALAFASWREAAPEEWYGEEDFFSVLETLDSGEQEALRTELNEYLSHCENSINNQG